MRKAALHNLGCKVNSYETEAMQQMLQEAGYEIVPFGEWADVYVINTCSVTNMADRKSRQMLHRAKKQNPQSIVVAAGCYVQTKETEAIADEAIDIIIGNNKKHELVSRLEEFFAMSLCETKADSMQQNAVQDEAKEACLVEQQKKINAMLDINGEKQEFEELYLEKPSEHTRAFIKVQDGCNQFCSYCIIPYARGRVRSRRLESVLEEVRRLAEHGYKEVVLTGIHLSSYGVESGESLLQLIQQVHQVEGIKRIRLGSLEPKIVTETFAHELSKLKKICPHFHLSLQSGCNETLKRMNRKYTAEEYAKGCGILRNYFAHPAITTDVIVGFPGETEEEFETTKTFLENIRFYEMHIFKYSKREGTKAAAMKEQVPEDVKQKRSAELIALGEYMSKQFRQAYQDTRQEVLFEELAEIEGTPYYVGYTKEYVKVAKKSETSLENQLVWGKLTKALNNEIYLME
uniref:tRNA (N(6)-L-threonylcarbamoyladenosine(37)-C(2))- methylthiotransferase MtaB n=1 Tax=Agathobacter sp. TaxID=2021311 RepID=UPI0040579ED9